MKKRDITLDVVKAVVIMLMVFGHCIQYGSGKAILDSRGFLDNPVFLAIYSFHMPMFMLVSGYLFGGGVAKRTWIEQLIRLVQSLLVPMLCWAVIHFLILYIGAFRTGDPMSPVYAVKVFLSRLISDLWYLWALFYCSVFATLVRRFFKDSPIVYLAALVLSFVLPDQYGLALYKYMYPYFLIGYFAQSKQWQRAIKAKKNTKNVLMATGILFVVLLVFFRKEYLIYLGGHTLMREAPLHWLWIDIYRFAIGLAGSVFVIELLRIAVKHTAKTALAVFGYVGQRTMGIYILSCEVFAYAVPQLTKDFGGIHYGRALLETVAVLAVCLLGTEIIRRIPIANRLLLGGR